MSTVIGIISLVMLGLHVCGAYDAERCDDKWHHHKMIVAYLAVAAWCFH